MTIKMNFKKTVQAVILNNDRILVVQRAKNESFLPNIWETPGGEVQRGETPEDGCIREVLEEVGISVVVKDPCHYFEYIDKENRKSSCTHYITCVQGEPTIKLSSEHTCYRWISQEEIKDIDVTPEMADALLAAFKVFSNK